MWQIKTPHLFCNAYLYIMNKNTNQIQELRDAYGLSQQQLALLLGVSRSLMSMMEIDKRSWPTGTTLKQIALEPFLLPAIPTDLKAQIDAKQQQLVDERKVSKQNSLYKKKQTLRNFKIKLEDYKTREQQAISALRLVDKVKTDWPEKSPKELAIHQTIWDVLSTESWIKLQEYGQAAQAELQEKIEALEVEINRWEGV